MHLKKRKKIGKFIVSGGASPLVSWRKDMKDGLPGTKVARSGSQGRF